MDSVPAAVSLSLFAQPPPPAAASGGPRSPRDSPRRAPVPAPETLHPTLWLGHQLARHADAAVPSGFKALDAQLPGGGWPRRALTELLLPHPGVGEIRLLGACLVATQKAGRLVMLFDPPAALSAHALAQLGFDVQQLLIVNTRTRGSPGTDSLWALEQALKSGHVGAVLAWLPPRLQPERLRRLQLAAHNHDGPAFVLRETSAAQRPSSAPLRLALRPGGADVLALRVLKRRGPPLEAPLKLDLAPVLSSMALQRARLGASAGLPAAANEPALALRAATFINLAAAR